MFILQFVVQVDISAGCCFRIQFVLSVCKDPFSAFVVC